MSHPQPLEEYFALLHPVIGKVSAAAGSEKINRHCGAPDLIDGRLQGQAFETTHEEKVPTERRPLGMHALDTRYATRTLCKQSREYPKTRSTYRCKTLLD